MEYSYSRDGENFFASEDTIEGAIIESGIEIGESILIGEQVPFVPHISAETIIEQLQCDACDHAGESAEEWLRYTDKEELKELEDGLNKVLSKWIEDKCYSPTFYGITDVKSHTRIK